MLGVKAPLLWYEYMHGDLDSGKGCLPPRLSSDSGTTETS